MNNPESDLQKELDNAIIGYAQLQVECMLMQYEGCNKIRNNDSENGLIILEAVRRMRESLKKQKDDLLGSISEEEFKEACKRAGFDKILYSSVSDAVLKDNTIYFELAPRPAGDAYKCDEMACKAKVYALALDYFPSLYKSVA